jgi:hypothetical protein
MDFCKRFLGDGYDRVIESTERRRVDETINTSV